MQLRVAEVSGDAQTGRRTELKPRRRSKPASMATYKRLLRKEIRERALEPEINFLNITAMLDMMTIILVFLLKSMSRFDRVDPAVEGPSPPEEHPHDRGVARGARGAHLEVDIVVDDNGRLPAPRRRSATASRPATRSSGPNDLVIVPLENAPSRGASGTGSSAWRTGKDPNASEAIIIADESRRTACSSRCFSRSVRPSLEFHLMVMQGKKPLRSRGRLRRSRARSGSRRSVRPVRLLPRQSLLRGRRFSLHPLPGRGDDEAC